MPLANLGRRYRALDGLRGLAAVGVLLYHTPWLTHFSGMRFVANAYLAVDFFFILSGFVIARNYASAIAGFASARAFLIMRLFRLYPLHLAILAVLFGIELLKWRLQGRFVSDVPPFTGPNSPRHLIESLLMAQGLAPETQLGWNPPSWSISAEFVAYIAFAAATAMGLIRRRPAILAMAGLGLAAYGLMAFAFGTLDVTLSFGLVRCVAGFCLGVAVALLTEGWEAPPLGRFVRPEVLGVASIVLCLAVVACARGAAIFLAIPAFTALVFVFQFDIGKLEGLFTARPAPFLGRISYSVYLIHMPAFQILTIVLRRALDVHSSFDGGRQTLMISSPWLGDLLLMVALAGVLGVSTLSFRWIEEPARKFGRRLAERGGPVIKSPASAWRRLAWPAPEEIDRLVAGGRGQRVRAHRAAVRRRS